MFEKDLACIEAKGKKTNHTEEKKNNRTRKSKKAKVSMKLKAVLFHYINPYIARSQLFTLYSALR